MVIDEFVELEFLLREIESVQSGRLFKKKKDIFPDKYPKQPEKRYKEIHKKVDALARSPPVQDRRLMQPITVQTGSLKRLPFMERIRKCCTCYVYRQKKESTR